MVHVHMKDGDNRQNVNQKEDDERSRRAHATIQLNILCAAAKINRMTLPARFISCMLEELSSYEVAYDLIRDRGQS